MVNVNPNSLGTIDPKIIPMIVVNCQKIQSVKPDPARW